LPVALCPFPFAFSFALEEWVGSGGLLLRGD